MSEWLARAARERPHHPAVAAGGRSVTYAELDARAGELAARFEPGQAVPIALPPGIAFSELLHAAWRAGAVAAPLDPAAPAPPLDALGSDRAGLVIHTSGTTGEPKAVTLTLENLAASARASAEALGTDPDDRWLCPLPLHHVAGLSILVRSAVNATTAVLHERFDTSRVKAALETGEVTLASLVPTMLIRLREAGLRAAPGLRTIALGGGPIPPSLLDWAARAGIPVTPVYGMTETASQVIAGEPGRPLAGVRLEVAADGELLIAGPMVARAALGPDGWLHTGDRGRLDAAGLLHIEGRIKELIVTGGEKVAPVEVEQVLQAHPEVADAGVAGRPDPEWGEAVVAFVVPRDGLRDDELRNWCRSRLAPHKVPKRFELVESLPRTANGKLQRERLI